MILKWNTFIVVSTCRSKVWRTKQQTGYLPALPLCYLRKKMRIFSFNCDKIFNFSVHFFAVLLKTFGLQTCLEVFSKVRYATPSRTFSKNLQSNKTVFFFLSFFKLSISEFRLKIWYTEEWRFLSPLPPLPPAPSPRLPPPRDFF